MGLSDETDTFPRRPDRWWRRAMDNELPLAIETAIELALRMRAVGARLPAAIEARLQNVDEPMILIERGEHRRIAAALVEKLDSKSGPRREHLREVIEQFFRRYERFAETDRGRNIWFHIQTRLMGGPGRDPNAHRRFFQQLLRGQEVRVPAQFIPQMVRIMELEIERDRLAAELHGDLEPALKAQTLIMKVPSPLAIAAEQSPWRKPPAKIKKGSKK